MTSRFERLLYMFKNIHKLILSDPYNLIVIAARNAKAERFKH